MGIPFSEIDDMNLYEFRLYQEGYQRRRKDDQAIARRIAYYALIGPGNIKHPPTIDEFWPLGDDVPKSLRKQGTEKWSQRKIQQANEYFTRKVREQLYGNDKRE